jgi:hypothetical protein
MSVLITAASDSVAFRLARLLIDKNLYMGSVEKMPPIGGTKFIKIPSFDSPSFSHELLKLCLDNHIHEVYPLRKDEMIELTSSKLLFEEFDVKIIIPSINFINLKLSEHIVSLSNLIVLINSVIVCGNIPPFQSVPFEEENGVFQWEIINDEVKFSLFAI